MKNQIVILLALLSRSMGLYAQPEMVKTICPEMHDSSDWVAIRSAKCPSFTEAELDRIEFPLNLVLRELTFSRDAVPEIYPGPPVSSKQQIEVQNYTVPGSGQRVSYIRMFYPIYGGKHTPFDLPEFGDWYYSFDVNIVPKEIEEAFLARLKKLENSPMFGRYHMTSPIPYPYLVPTDYIAKYIRKIPVTPDNVLSLYVFNERVPDEKVNEIWAICYVPVDSSWIPTMPPLTTITPLALRTDKKLYLYSVQVKTGGPMGGNIDHFEGAVLDLSRSIEIERSYNAAIKIFSEEIEKEFKLPPIAAMKIEQGLNPNQIRFARRFDESIVLKGFAGPYYELSTYTIIFWRGPSGNFLGHADSYFAHNDPVADSQLYMQAFQSLQVSTGKKGVYGEPSLRQYSDYGKVVQAALGRSVERAVERVRALHIDQ